MGEVMEQVVLLVKNGVVVNAIVVDPEKGGLEKFQNENAPYCSNYDAMVPMDQNVSGGIGWTYDGEKFSPPSQDTTVEPNP